MAHKKSINIIIADDNEKFIEGLKLYIYANSSYQIINVLTSGKELTETPDLARADVLLLDIQLPDITGIDAAKNVIQRYPNLPIIAMTMHQEKVYLDDIISVGFKGFIHKPELVNELFKAIDKVIAGKFAFPDDLTD